MFLKIHTNNLYVYIALKYMIGISVDLINGGLFIPKQQIKEFGVYTFEMATIMFKYNNPVIVYCIDRKSNKIIGCAYNLEQALNIFS